MGKSFYDDDSDDRAYKQTVMTCVAAASLVMLIFLAALYYNSAKSKAAKLEESKAQAQAMAEEEERANAEMESLEIGKSNKVSSDYDFWDLYEGTSPSLEEYSTEKKTVKQGKDRHPDGIVQVEEEETSDESEKEDANSRDMLDSLIQGNKIAVLDEKGNRKWYDINENLERNTYDFVSKLKNDGGVFSYEGEQKSSFGIDVSSSQGTIDWSLVKNAGVEFAILRIVSRGYQSGQITIDESFVKNLEEIQKNQLKYGVYVYSQAISELEAIEEANYAVAALAGKKPTYPVVCDVERVESDSARTDSLEKEERTKYVKAFCDTVKSYGYKCAIRAERDMLLTGLDLERLKEYDIWLKAPMKEQGQNTEPDYPDYPYRYTMWQYSDKGNINGISSGANMNLCFVNYEER